MDDQTRPAGMPADEPAAPGADETFTWTGDADEAPGHASGGAASNVIDQLRATAEDLAEKAAPAVRELSAKAAELTAVAAVKAAPLVKRAGEVTAEASEKLAESARTWADQIRGGGDEPGTTGGMATSPDAGPGVGYGTPAATVDDAPTPSDLAADTGITADTSSGPAPFETTGEGGDDRAPDGPTI